VRSKETFFGRGKSEEARYENKRGYVRKPCIERKSEGNFKSK
jgi:hypothetical protein